MRSETPPPKHRAAVDARGDGLRNVPAHLVVVGPDGRSDRSQDPVRLREQSGRPVEDPRCHPSPAGVDDGQPAGRRVGQRDRHAVSGEDDERHARGIRDHPVAFRVSITRRGRNDARSVHLPDRDDSVDRDGSRQAAPVLLDAASVVARHETEIEAGECPFADAAGAFRERHQEPLVAEPVGHQSGDAAGEDLSSHREVMVPPRALGRPTTGRAELCARRGRSGCGVGFVRDGKVSRRGKDASVPSPPSRVRRFLPGCP